MKKTVLILSGPTHEYFDPVRFIGNASSGLMGKALAEEARNRDCRVEFVSGPVAPANLPDIDDAGKVHNIVSAADMLSVASGLFQAADTIIFAAAVADYAPVEKRSEKMARSSDELILHLRPTADIARTLCKQKQPDQIAIGFALQTSDGEANARRKLAEKRLDGIVLNTPATLGASNGTFSFLCANSDEFEPWGCIDKTACARNIFDAIECMTPKGHPDIES